MKIKEFTINGFFWWVLHKLGKHHWEWENRPKQFIYKAKCEFCDRTKYVDSLRNVSWKDYD